VFDSQVTRSGNVTFAIFSRKLHTNDTAEHDHDIVPDKTQILWAYNAHSDSLMSKHTARGEVTLDFLTGKIIVTGTAPDRTPLFKIVHGILMAVGFGLFMVAGIAVSSFVSKKISAWFPTHVLLMIGGTLLIGAAFALAVYFNWDEPFVFSTTTRTRGIHGLVGVILVCSIVLQIVLGVVIDRIWRAEHRYVSSETHVEKTNIGEYIHWWFGRVICILGVGNVFLGLYEDQFQYFYFIGAGIVVLGWLIFYVVMYIRKYKASKNEEYTHLTDSDQWKSGPI
jgi:protein-S-isoprenylcysteine O-methyltransferase Ste14